MDFPGGLDRINSCFCQVWRQFANRPYLDAAHTSRRDLRRYLNGFVQIPGIDQIKPGQLLFRLGKGTVTDTKIVIIAPLLTCCVSALAASLLTRRFFLDSAGRPVFQ
jgi:hypothetical protein